MHAFARIAVVVLCALSFAAVTGAASFAADEPANIIKYRRNVMKAIGANIANIAMVVKGEVTYSANVPFNARSIRDALNLVDPLFPPGTDTGDTNALPKIWEDAAGFNDVHDKAQAAADAMVQAAESGDAANIAAALGDLGKACGNCHKPYRVDSSSAAWRP
ncbi:MAG TPA: cytochrome c [Alphaproteobacteria bacterium]